MAFFSISQNYQGRKVDLSIFPDLNTPATPVISGLSGFGSISRAVAGPGKAAQNYALTLLTPLGSRRSRPDMGSLFLPKIRSGSVRYPADLVSLFAIENLRVLNYLNIITNSIFEDEQISSVLLTDYGVTTSGLTMNLNLSVVSGDTLPFLLPVVWNS